MVLRKKPIYLRKQSVQRIISRISQKSVLHTLYNPNPRAVFLNEIATEPVN